ncbi:hypothetical protein NYO99_11835 [Pelomonas sp. UHG3]|uniref:Uncharacterized protein n=1 Tax=Roseateles hydrophilus TaxID=2975054 RepID=A0ACC6CBA9_9BURK|nr:hypothetical protein [Pelomonas sp. UHG3]MCY4745665.1 hypothetical protein [Pelomonas sp. UHG3]
MEIIKAGLRERLWQEPDSAATNDYYWRRKTRADDEGVHRFVAPDVAGPQGQRLWAWLAGFGQAWNLPRGPENAEQARRDFNWLGSPGSPVAQTSYHMACALELLGVSLVSKESIARLLEIGAPSDPAKVFHGPDREWIKRVWNGIYALMEQCLLAVDAKVEDLPEACFAPLRRDGTDRTVQAFKRWGKGGYADWREFTAALGKDDVWCLNLKSTPNAYWHPIIRIWACHRPYHTVAVPFQPVLAESWVGRCRRPEGEVGFPQKDAPWGRQPSFVSPIALLIAAMAMDKYISSDKAKLRRLEEFMKNQNALFGVVRIGDNWAPDDVFARISQLRLLAQGRVMGAPLNPAGPQERPGARFLASPEKQSNQSMLAGAQGVVQAVRLRPPTFHGNDRSTLAVRIPYAALGTALDDVLAQWVLDGPACFVDVLDDATLVHEAVFLAEVEAVDRAEPAADAIELLLRPRPPACSRLLRHWEGTIPDHALQYECWLVNAAANPQVMQPMLLLRVTM